MSWTSWVGKNVGWGNVFGAVLGGASSYLGAKSEEKAAERNVALEGAEARKTIGFQKELDKYYVDKDRQERGAALTNFRKYNTNRFPGMPADTNYLPNPVKPSLTEYNKNG